MPSSQQVKNHLSLWQGVIALLLIFISGGVTFGVLSNRVSNLEEKDKDQQQRIEKIVDSMVNKTDFNEMKQDIKEIRQILLNKSPIK